MKQKAAFHLDEGDYTEAEGVKVLTEEVSKKLEIAFIGKEVTPESLTEKEEG